jgi:hypothetical protein
VEKEEVTMVASDFVPHGYIIATAEVAQKRKPVGYLYREPPDSELDSGWRVFSGEEQQEYVDDPGNLAMYNASTIVEIDPSIAPLLAFPAPVAFERSESGEFVRVPFEVPADASD